jgi:ABC-2 type transport system permease protein
MSRPVSHARVIGDIVRKDLGEYTRDRLWAFLTVLVLVFVVAIFWVLPNEVDESIDVGITGIIDPAALGALEASEEGLTLVSFTSEEDLRSVVAGEAEVWLDGGRTVVVSEGADAPDGAEEAKVSIGLAFPDDFLAATAAGRQTDVTVYVDGAVPEEIEGAMSSLVRELAFAVSGSVLPVDTPSPNEVFVILGEDRVGNQTTARDSFRPIFVFLILLMEMFVMASLIAKEIQDRTVTAMLITPATIGDVLAAKGISGAISGMAQAIIVLVAINALGTEPVLILLFMLLGAVMVSGTAMIAGSSGKDFISTLFYGMAFMIPLMIPAFGALFPGTPSLWIRALPSYPLVDGLVEITTYGGGWSDTMPQLALLAGWCVVLFALGWVILRRKVQSL